MRALFALFAACLLAAGCPSAYQRTYEQTTERLQMEQHAADEREAAAHAQASRYAAVIYFDVGSADIGPEGQRELRWFIQQMQPYPKAVFLIQGFADSTGTEGANQTLSEDRAGAVASYLRAQGIDSSRLIVQGYGARSTAAPNATAHGRGRNRRVEVTVQ
ncbi:MAG TPA: OmpA family protein [Candidatus Binatia bacterium]|nr:OmpA family protein [Candidatus Binatia bacterium]